MTGSYIVSTVSSLKTTIPTETKSTESNVEYQNIKGIVHNFFIFGQISYFE